MQKKDNKCKCGHKEDEHFGMVGDGFCHFKDKDGHYCCDCKHLEKD